MSLFSSQNNILIFVIGRPAAGKTTFVRYLKRCLGWRTQIISDYDLLISRIKTLTPAQILWKNGQFEIVDRSIFDDLLTEIAECVHKSRGKRNLIVEISRPDYLRILTHFPDFCENPFPIVYLQAEIDACIRRNLARYHDHPINVIPESVMTRYFVNDDIKELLKMAPGWTRVVENTRSLSNLEREAILLAEELLHQQKKPTSCFLRSLPWTEILIPILIMGYIVMFLLLAVYFWQSTSSSAIGILAHTPAKLALMKTLGLVMCGGGLGSTTYCMRALYHYYIEGKFDFDRFKWWYFFRPQAGSILALAMYAIARGGVSAISGATSSPPANLSWFGVAFLAGFGTEQVIEWLRRASKSMFGESRVQPENPQS